MRKMLLVLLCVGVVMGTASGSAQTAPPPTTVMQAAGAAEAAIVADAWGALARGDVKTASSKAAELKKQWPHSGNGLLIEIEINLINGGPSAALDGYDQWRNGRTTEEPLALRRIASAILVEHAQKSTSPASRTTALAALAADGNLPAQEALRTSADAGSLADAAALAAAGNQAGVQKVVTALAGPAPNKIALVEALAAGRNQSAIPALVTMLGDPRPEHQAAAATALGQLGARDQIARLQAMLKTPNAPPYVTMAAAGALLKLDDLAGYDRLQGWLHSEVPGMRAAAAKALSSRPDANWTAVVRELTRDTDPMVRLDAAEMLMPYDPDLGRATLTQLGQDQNPTIRDLALQASVTTLPGDLAQLRALLRQPDVVRVPAAKRVLELTR